MLDQNSIIQEAADKLAMGRGCKTEKHCGVRDCGYASTGVCRVHGTEGVCMTRQNAQSYAWLHKVCKDELALNAVLLARNAFADKAARDAEILALATPEVTEQSIASDYIQSIAGGV